MNRSATTAEELEQQIRQDVADSNSGNLQVDYGNSAGVYEKLIELAKSRQGAALSERTLKGNLNVAGVAEGLAMAAEILGSQLKLMGEIS